MNAAPGLRAGYLGARVLDVIPYMGIARRLPETHNGRVYRLLATAARYTGRQDYR